MTMEKADKIAYTKRQNKFRGLLLVGLLVFTIGIIFLLRKEEESYLNQQEHERLLIRQHARHVQQIHELEARFQQVEDQVRKIKATPNIIMETDKHALEITKQLQEASRNLCEAKYGKTTRIRVDLQFPSNNQTTSFTIETAPIEYIPYSVYNFLEVVRTLQTRNGIVGGFHRKAGHVLQVTLFSQRKALAFQEYSEHFPHKKETVGYCGRPSGTHGCWYISTMDNTRNHGPGSQQKHNPYEADANFGRLLSSEEYNKVEPMIRQALPKDGFIEDKNHWVWITKMTILVPNKSEGPHPSYREWRDSASDAAMTNIV